MTEIWKNIIKIRDGFPFTCFFLLRIKFFRVILSESKHLKKLILLPLIVLIILFCYGCRENSSEPDNQNFGQEIRVSGQIVSDDSTFLMHPLQILLVGESTYTDSSDDMGYFEFLISEQGTFRLIIKDEDYKNLDSVFVIRSDTLISVSLQPVLNDYFPLNIGDRLTYIYSLKELCSGDNIYIDGIEDWVIADLRTSKDSIFYKCRRNFNGIKIDARGPDTPDTSVVNISDEFSILEDKKHNVYIDHPDFISGITFPRYYNRNFPDEIVYEATSGFVFIYRLKKQTGLTFWQQTTGSGHCSTTKSWSLTE